MAEESKNQTGGTDRQPSVSLADAQLVSYPTAPEGFVPDPYVQFAQYGNVDTSDTAGPAHQQIDSVTPVFAIGRQRAAINAGRALDPNDPGFERRSVIMPERGTAGYDEAYEKVMSTAEVAASTPVEVGGPTVFERAAAVDTSEEAESAQPTQDRGTTPMTESSATGDKTEGSASSTRRKAGPQS